MAEQTSTVTITELDNAGQHLRSIVLRGAALPFRGVPYGGEPRVPTFWYPGNADEATQHVMGPTEKQTDWEGFWRTTQLNRSVNEYTDETGNTAYLNNAFVMYQALEDMLRTGLLCRVVWSVTIRGATFTILREGRASAWNFKFDRPDDIAWDITWEWVSRGRRQQKVVALRTGQLDTKIGSMVLALTDTQVFIDFDPLMRKKKARKSSTTFSLGQLENLIDAPQKCLRSFTRKIQQITNRAKKRGELIDKVRTVPIQLTNDVLDTANNTVSICNNFIDTMSRRPPETNVAKMKVSTLTRATSYYGGAVTQTQILRRAAQGLRSGAQGSEKSRKTMLAVHVVRQFESLWVLSLKYYGNAEYSAGIARANRLPLNTITVRPGTVLIIPTIDVVRGFTPQGG